MVKDLRSACKVIDCKYEALWTSQNLKISFANIIVLSK